MTVTPGGSTQRGGLFLRMTALLCDAVEQGPEIVRERVAAEKSAATGRDPAQRRAYAERRDPVGYISDVLGVPRLSPQQEDAIGQVLTHDRVLIPAANNVGKTFLLSAIGLYFFDAVGAVLGPNGEELGCQLLLPGPDHITIRDTIYAAMLEHAARAEQRGFPMPGERSEKSVYWRVGPRWFMRAFAPPKDKRRAIAHTASGRHHPNQHALVEEGAGVEEIVWRAVEGMCSGEDETLGRNKVISAFNPSESRGPVWERARRGRYVVIHLSGLDHPNVRERRIVIPGAISPRELDERVRTECDRLGPWPGTSPDPDRGDFVYAVPPTGAQEVGPRHDGIPGHPQGEPHVWRPGPIFAAQGLGQWPRTDASSLFDPGSWDRAVERWRAGFDPEIPPDRIGVDAALEGDDSTVAAPAWGLSGPELLEAWFSIHRAVERLASQKISSAASESAAARAQAEADQLERMRAELEERLGSWLGGEALEGMARESVAEALGQEVAEEVAPAAASPETVAAVRAKIDAMLAASRIRVGRLRVAPKGDGPDVARWLAVQFPDSPLVVDEGGVGRSVVDHLRRALERQVGGVSFGSSPLPRIPGEILPINLRTQMYLRAAALIRFGLVDLPDDPMLRDEVFAHELTYTQRAVEIDGKREIAMLAQLEPKARVKERIGRSPDRADALVLSLMPLVTRRKLILR